MRGRWPKILLAILLSSSASQGCKSGPKPKPAPTADVSKCGRAPHDASTILLSITGRVLDAISRYAAPTFFFWSAFDVLTGLSGENSDNGCIMEQVFAAMKNEHHIMLKINYQKVLNRMATIRRRTNNKLTKKDTEDLISKLRDIAVELKPLSSPRTSFGAYSMIPVLAGLQLGLYEQRIRDESRRTERVYWKNEKNIMLVFYSKLLLRTFRKARNSVCEGEEMERKTKKPSHTRDDTSLLRNARRLDVGYAIAGVQSSMTVCLADLSGHYVKHLESWIKLATGTTKGELDNMLKSTMTNTTRRQCTGSTYKVKLRSKLSKWQVKGPNRQGAGCRGSCTGRGPDYIAKMHEDKYTANPTTKCISCGSQVWKSSDSGCTIYDGDIVSFGESWKSRPNGNIRIEEFYEVFITGAESSNPRIPAIEEGILRTRNRTQLFPSLRVAIESRMWDHAKKSLEGSKLSN